MNKLSALTAGVVLGLMGGTVAAPLALDDPAADEARALVDELAATYPDGGIAGPGWFGLERQEVRARLGIPAAVHSTDAGIIYWSYESSAGESLTISFHSGELTSIDG